MKTGVASGVVAGSQTPEKINDETDELKEVKSPKKAKKDRQKKAKAAKQEQLQAAAEKLGIELNSKTQIFCEAFIGNLDAIKAYLANGGSVNAYTSAPTSTDNQTETKTFLANTKSASARTFNVITLLSCAAQAKQSSVVECLLTQQIPESKSLQEAFFKAAKTGDVKSAELLYKTGKININEPTSGKTRRTPLMLASIGNHPAFISWLVDLPKINLNQCFKKKRTALMFAAKHGATEAAKELLDAKADRTIEEEKTNFDALLLAVVHGHAETVKKFVENHKDPVELKEIAQAICEVRSKIRSLPKKQFEAKTTNLSIASKLEQTLSYLVAQYNNLISDEDTADITTEDLILALPHIIAAQDHKLIEELLQKLESKTLSNLSNEAQIELDLALLLSARHGYDVLIGRLIKLGANIDRADRWGLTALMHATLNGHLKTVNALLILEASVDLPVNPEALQNINVQLNEFDASYDAYKDVYSYPIGMTALMLATREDQAEIAAKLIEYGADSTKRSTKRKAVFDYAKESTSSTLQNNIQTNIFSNLLTNLFNQDEAKSHATAIAKFAKVLTLLKAERNDDKYFECKNISLFKSILPQNFCCKSITFSSASAIKIILNYLEQNNSQWFLEQIWLHSKEKIAYERGLEHNEKKQSMHLIFNDSEYKTPAIPDVNKIYAQIINKIRIATDLVRNINKLKKLHGFQNHADQKFDDLQNALDVIEKTNHKTQPINDLETDLMKLNNIVKDLESIQSKLEIEHKETKSPSKAKEAEEKYRRACKFKLQQQEEKEREYQRAQQLWLASKQTPKKPREKKYFALNTPTKKSILFKENKPATEEQKETTPRRKIFFCKPTPWLDLDSNQALQKHNLQIEEKQLDSLLAMENKLPQQDLTTWQNILRDALLFICAQIMENYKQLITGSAFPKGFAQKARNVIFHHHGFPISFAKTIDFAKQVQSARTQIKAKTASALQEVKTTETKANPATADQSLITLIQKHVIPNKHDKIAEWNRGLDELRLLTQLQTNCQDPALTEMLQSARKLTLARLHCYGIKKNNLIIPFHKLNEMKWDGLNRPEILKEVQAAILERHPSSVISIEPDAQSIKALIKRRSKQTTCRATATPVVANAEVRCVF